MTMLEAAIHYASLGLPVFPLWPVLPFKDGLICSCTKTIRCESPAKHPIATLVRHGVKDATTDEKMIRHWWAARADANIGLATGGQVIVVDIDPRHGGDRSLAELERAHDKLPDTWRVRTGGGGLHVYFIAPPDIPIANSAGKLGDGLDVRARGGYVIAPPSRHISGATYEWTAAKDLAPLPTWIISALQQKKSATPSSDWSALVRDGVVDGKRNVETTRLVGYLLRRYVDPHVVLELVLDWNAQRCRPPLPSAEIIGIVNSIAKRELARRAS